MVSSTVCQKRVEKPKLDKNWPIIHLATSVIQKDWYEMMAKKTIGHQSTAKICCPAIQHAPNFFGYTLHRTIRPQPRLVGHWVRWIFWDKKSSVGLKPLKSKCGTFSQKKEKLIFPVFSYTRQDKFLVQVSGPQLVGGWHRKALSLIHSSPSSLIWSKQNIWFLVSRWLCWWWTSTGASQ